MKKILFFIVILIVSLTSDAQIVLECSYNVNGLNNSSLCVIHANSNYGKCHVLSNMGSCWFDAYYQNHGDYTTITISNPSEQRWIGGSFYFLSGGSNYVVFQGNKFPVYPNLISRQAWNNKLRQYGFNDVYTGPCMESVIDGNGNKMRCPCNGVITTQNAELCSYCPHYVSSHRR